MGREKGELKALPQLVDISIYFDLVPLYKKAIRHKTANKSNKNILAKQSNEEHREEKRKCHKNKQKDFVIGAIPLTF